jgi:tRNA (uracil-5-)-methyltransferase TRM9
MLYTNIAVEFDRTRGYVWPCVRNFIDSIQDKSRLSIFEAGCGNGRNLLYARNAGFGAVSGIDILPKFVEICQSKSLDVSIGDILEQKTQRYDIILSVAVIHHLDSEEKRIRSIKNLLNSLKEGGRLFLTFWSYEKGNSIAKKDFMLGDNIVPWRSKRTGEILENRYYYIYDRELLESMLNQLGLEYRIEWEEQNLIVIIEKKVDSLSI